MRLITVVGARPSFVKVAPLVPHLTKAGIGVDIAYTGTRCVPRNEQRRPARMSFFGVEVPTPKWFLDVGCGPEAATTGRATAAFDRLFARQRPDAALVIGDGSSTLAAAVAASKAQLPVIHLEAGLRCHDLSMPEEVNRVLISRLASLHLAPTEDALVNLEREGVSSDRVHFVGSMLAEAVLTHLELIGSAQAVGRFGATARRYVLGSFQSARVLADPVALRGLVRALGSLGQPVLAPDPGQFRRAISAAGVQVPPNLRVVDAVSYPDMLALQRDASAVVTDSSGVQEEACVVGTPCVTVRGATERCVTVTCGGNRLASASEDSIRAALHSATSSGRTWTAPKRWDRAVSGRVVRAILRGTDAVQ